MKYILILTLAFSSFLFASSQVILGSYKSSKGAINVKIQLDTIIANDLKFRDFLVKNSIKSSIDEDGKYFIVTLGPINDIVTEHAILNKVKKTNFQDAFILKIKKSIQSDNSDLLIEEPKLENINPNLKIKEKKVPKKVHLKKIKLVQPQNNILEEYFNEIIATFAILILSIIYLIIKKKQHTFNGFENRTLKKEKAIKQIDKEKDLKEDIEDEITSENEIIFEIPINNEIIFDTFDEETKPIIQNTPSILSDIKKKKVPPHEKIIKNDFKKFAGIRIMIAEDNIINQKVINGLLSDSQIDIVTLDDGEQVLKYLQKDSNFSIILMDAHMPNMDGFEATKQIRANPEYSHITVIALSGDTAQDDIQKMKNAGMQEHLEKPLKMDPLYDVLYAYSSVTTEFKNLPKALNIENGLEVCSNDIEFYKEILKDFIQDNSHIPQETKELLDNKEFEKAKEYLLDISGVAANIGATTLHNLANELRVSLQDPNDAKYLDIFSNYSQNYLQLEKEIKEYL